MLLSSIVKKLKHIKKQNYVHIEVEDSYYLSAHNVNWDNGIETNYFKNGRYYELIETKEVKVKGYNKNAPYRMK